MSENDQSAQIPKDSHQNGLDDDPEPAAEAPTRWQDALWTQIVHSGWGEPVKRFATHAFLVVLVIVVIGALRTLFLDEQRTGSSQGGLSAFAAPLPTPTPTMAAPILPEYSAPEFVHKTSVQRSIEPYTIIPSRPQVDVLTYTVQTGDSVFGIADRFGLKPETILWGNYTVLADNPHRLQPDQILTILPTNGTYHKWSTGENLQKVADFYNVAPSEIIEWPGNPFDIYGTDIENPNLLAGTMLIVPNGQREMIDYGPPRIPRDNPAVARTYGPGHCGELTDGAIGIGSFIWPTLDRHITGYDYSPSTNHWGLDIDGDLGSAVWSIDNGVVVYSGWSYNGYGNLVVVDHGNGWQSLYAHLNDIYVGCGESVFQGTILGGLGTTGNSSGPHLHFELIYGSTKVNPWDFLS